MKVFINGKVYDSEKRTIVLKVSETEKQHIKDMPLGYYHYLSEPEGDSVEAREKRIKKAIEAFNKSEKGKD